MDLAPPDPGELEVSLFGPGYGEGIALHLGDGRWMIVDSCIVASTKRSAPLAYLEAIGVDPAKDVVAVLATHWHDDHVRGLAEALEVCKAARFYCSMAVRSEEFLELTQAKVLGAEKTTSGVREFSRMLATVRERKAAGVPTAGPAFLLENTVVYRNDHCVATALSPSSAAIERTLAGIASMLPEQRRPHLRVAAPEKNEGSVALWVSGQAGCALLAADLERENSDDRGWGAVLALAPAGDGRAGLAKVPHHGSESGHDQRMWDELLEAEPQAFLTPWHLGVKTLPTEQDRERIKALAPEAVQVGKSGAKPKDRYDPSVERVLKEVVETRRAALGRTGHARARCGPDHDGRWQMKLAAEAFPLADAA